MSGSRRVVVTGIGLVTPLGANVDDTWSRLIEGRSGIGSIERFDVSDLPARIGGMLPEGEGGFVATDYVEAKDIKKNDLFIIYGIAAATQAIRDSGISLETEEQKQRAGVMIGAGIGGLQTIAETTLVLESKGPRRVSPFFIPAALINLCSGQVSIRHGLKGPNHSAVTACSTGAHAIGDAARLIALDDADIMVAGGTEAAICRLGLAGFAAARALSTSYNDTPERASRPWDKGRDGFVMGEGAGVVVLEELEHARRRGATIYAEVKGYGLSGDAYHITSPAPEHDGAFRSMKAAIKRSGLGTADIDYVNAHGTSTPAGDELEFGAVARLFGDDKGGLSMSSTKSAIGHLLGAAGSVESIFCILAMRDQVVPPTLNLDNPADDCTGIDLVPHEARRREVKACLTNSFGFGGTNASLVLTHPDLI
ncbi:MAG: beta-ketoacyl-ACP synthase II [Geminicoccaceae bacterium]|nr:beta-ketoacyl-ACP synthase II [Geminicoccaceae bacterium]